MNKSATLPVTPKVILSIASVLYLVSNIGWLFAHGVFWDDWVLYENPVGMIQMLNSNGFGWTIPFHMFLLNLSHQLNTDVILIYRVIILFVGWGNLLLYYSNLKQLDFNRIFVLFSTLMYASWPLGYSHMLMCCIFYQIGVLSQLITIYLFSLYVNEKKKNIVNKVVLFILIFLFQFFASACLQSTIVFWFGYLCVMATYQTYNDIILSYRYAMIWVKRFLYYILFFMPCLIFWGLKMVYMVPYGIYGDYNTVTITNVIYAPINSIIPVFNTISFLIHQFSFVFSSILFFLVFLTILIVLRFLLKNNCYNTKSTPYPVVLSFCFMFFCAIEAYVLVAKIPSFDHVNDRFCVLLALIVPLIIVSLIVNYSNTPLKLAFVFISVFCTYSVSQSVEGIRLSHRNDAIMEFFRVNDLPQGNVLVAEECPKIRSNYYSWAGLYYTATGRQDRCFECTDVGVMSDDEKDFNEMNHQKEAKSGSPNNLIYFVDENSSKSYNATFRRLVLHFTDKANYRQVLLNDFHIRWCRIIED